MNLVRIEVLLIICVRDSSEKPTAKRGLVADSPTRRGTPQMNNPRY